MKKGIVKTYEDFIKGESPETQSVLSDDLRKAVQECYKKAKKELKECNEGNNKSVTAKKWINEYKKFHEECMRAMMKESDGEMPKGSQAGQA